MKFIVWAIVIYLLYRLIFDFVVPVSKVSSQIRQNVKNMQQQQKAAQEQYQRQQEQHKQASTSQQAPRKPQGEEYIEFEEVK